MTPAFVLAGTRSGVGKTTIATGIMGALARDAGCAYSRSSAGLTISILPII